MIILTPETAAHQVAELIQHYPDLEVVESNQELIRLRGRIYIYRTTFNYTLNRSYEVEINIPLNSTCLPTVMDIEGAVDASFPHRYINGELCLETDTAVKLYFIEGFNLLKWIREFVEPYYFSYDYYCRYGVFPFGEHPHGIDGIMDTYQDIFLEKDMLATLKLMTYCCETRKYRGHANCPCGSGEKIRNCHGKGLLPIMTDSRKKEIVINDTKYIMEEIEKYELARKNKAATKR